jgi:hypothetical protein
MASPSTHRHTYGTRGNSSNPDSPPTDRMCLSCFETLHLTEHCPRLQKWIPKPEKARKPRKSQTSTPSPKRYQSSPKTHPVTYQQPQFPLRSPLTQELVPSINTAQPQHQFAHQFAPAMRNPTYPASHFSTPYPFDAYVRDYDEDRDSLEFPPSIYDTPPPKFTSSEGYGVPREDPNYVAMREFIQARLPNPFHELQGLGMPGHIGLEVQPNGYISGQSGFHSSQATSPESSVATPHYDEATWSDRFDFSGEKVAPDHPVFQPGTSEYSWI